MPDQHLDMLITAAVERIMSEMEQAAPFMAGQVTHWMRSLGGSDRPADYFTHPIAFPMLLLPCWLEQTLHAAPDPAFQADLIYSTINGYYFIRLLDNVMDEDATVERKLLPAAGFFHTQFQAPYQRYFPDQHPFWPMFKAVWFHAANSTIEDAALSNIDRATFIRVAAQKVSAARIPLAAVCYRYQRPDAIEAWTRLVDLLGAWHQMFNDLLSWHKDLTHGAPTYLLSEAERRREPAEPIGAWVLREGFAWAMEMLAGWMAELKALAAGLRSTHLEAYLDTRETMLLKQYEEVGAGLRSAARLFTLAERANTLKVQA